MRSTQFVGKYAPVVPPRWIPVKARALLRQASAPGLGWVWAVDPYEGCELGCCLCAHRLDGRDHAAWTSYESRIFVKQNAAELLLKEIGEQPLEGRTIVLGHSTEPWQPAEEQFRVTRTVLEALREVEDLDLRVYTRSSLIARDTDLFQELHARGRVRLTVSVASLDERINRLVEPKSPSLLRRLAALEALARAGLKVGLQIAPVLPGLDEDELGMSTLLKRAASAGASFASYRLLEMSLPEKEQFLAHVTSSYPQAAVRFRRVLGRRPIGEAQRASFAERFEAECRAVGLEPETEGAQMRPRLPAPPTQLVLF